jgi:hypothetical protein
VDPAWSQAWRRPLREAMDWLRDTLASIYEDGTKGYLEHPWRARDDYIDVVLDRTAENVERFFERNGIQKLSREEKSKTLKHLEMQRNAMLMFTSCGWFFDEISGIETTQVLQYAARAIQLAEELSGVSVEENYLQMLWKSRSNIPEFENGARVYEMFVKPAAVDLLRVGAHYGISSLFEEYPKPARIYCYTADSEVYEKIEAGRLRLAIGKTHLRSEITWDEEPVSFAVLHLGDHNLNGGVRKFMGDEAFATLRGEVTEAFHRGDASEVIRLMDRHFGMNHYSSRHLFKDEQRKILNRILSSVLGEVEISFRKMFEENYPIMSFLQSLNMPFPKPLSAAAEHVLNSDLKKTFEQEDLNLEKLGGLIKEVKRWAIEVDKETIGFVATSWINAAVERLQGQPDEATIYQELENVLMLLESIHVEPDLWKAQNAHFSVARTLYPPMKERAEKGEEPAGRWVEWFRRLGDRLHVKVT